MGCVIKLLIASAVLLVLSIVAVFGLIWVVEENVPIWVEEATMEATSYPLDLGDTQVKLFNGMLDAQNAVLQNPSEFPIADFLEVRQFKVDLDFAETGEVSEQSGADTLVFSEVILDISKMAYVRNAEGLDNVTLLQQRAEEFAEIYQQEAEQQQQDTGETTPTDFLIRRLVLKVDQVVFRNDQGVMGTQLGTDDRTIDLNFSHEARDVRDLKTALQPLWDTLKERGMREMTGQMMQNLPDDVSPEDRNRIQEGINQLRGLLPGSKQEEPPAE